MAQKFDTPPAPVDLGGRKKELRKEMDQIQKEIESSLHDIRETVSSRSRFSYWVDHYPLHLLGAALLAGFLLGRKDKPAPDRSPRKTDSDEISAQSHDSSDYPSSGKTAGSLFAGMLTDELKKMAVQRAVKWIVKRVEDAVEERKKQAE